MRETADLQESASSTMVAWQYRKLMGQLMLAQDHAVDKSCPCEFTTEHEYCLPKHLILIQSYCEETIPMVEEGEARDLLHNIAGGANDLRRAYEEAQDGRPYGDIAEFARESRKALEPYLFQYKVPAEADGSPLLTFLEEKMTGMPAPFGWVGGKHQLSKDIVKLIPPHRIYCEPFCGSAAVFWRHPRSEVEVLNDKDRDLMRFYRDLGDIDHCDVKSLSNRFELLKERRGELKPCEFLSLNQCSYHSKMMSKFLSSDCKANEPLFHKRLPRYQERIRGVKLMCGGWERAVRKHDSPETFFYLDPPYHNTSRGYQHGEDQLVRLAEVLPTLKGKWLLSYDDDDEVREAFHFNSILAVASRYTIGGLNNDKKGKQLLIANYPLDGAGLKEGGTMQQDDFKPVGQYLVHRYEVLGTGVMVYDVYEPDQGDHSTIMSIKGKRYGTVSSRILPVDLAKLPAGNERVSKVMQWQEGNYREAYRTILQAYPDLKNRTVRWSGGEAVTLKEGKMGEKITIYTVVFMFKGVVESIGTYTSEAVAKERKKQHESDLDWEAIGPIESHLDVPAGVGMAEAEMQQGILPAVGMGLGFAGGFTLFDWLKGKMGKSKINIWIKDDHVLVIEDPDFNFGLNTPEQTIEHLLKVHALKPENFENYNADVGETHPYAREIPSDVYYYSTTIEKHYRPSSACHKGSVRVLKPSVGSLVYMGCLKKDKWDAEATVCSPNPTVLMTIVLNNKKNRDEAEHLKLTHPEIKEHHKESERGVEPRVGEGEIKVDADKPELVEVLEAMSEAKEV